MRQFIWEYISGKGTSSYIVVFTEWEYISGKGKSTYIFAFAEVIHLGIYKWKGKIHLYIVFQFGKSFGNI